MSKQICGFGTCCRFAYGSGRQPALCEVHKSVKNVTPLPVYRRDERQRPRKWTRKTA